ncbi:hypothetical protein LSH36_178g06009 [Paralvinella palmiformis]|uniref:C2 domain-containing protein n=1 Tax=Paralvinella palmiformis TaxID=53620 RepID=A0AAD9N613_9ANNE|nr:hypothetical protein LSH36_178g06009 [Paralvinella palmiformis]
MTKQVGAHGAQSLEYGMLQEMGRETFDPRASSVPSSVVELSVSCRNLCDMDVLSKSDPMVVAYSKEFASGNWREIGRTEIVWNNLNPNFVKKFVMDYFFEESQKLKFDVYDVDSKKKHHDLKRHEEITLALCGHQLDKKDFFGKSDPFLLFYRSNEDSSFTVVHKTEVIKNTLNPTWKPFTVPVRALCNGDYDRTLKIECYDYNKNGSHDFIGVFTSNLRELSSMTVRQFECINPKKKAKKGGKYKHSGVIELLSAKIQPIFTFLDYIRGGTQVHCIIAIDFTASNGDPTSPQSLHYINPYQPNLYARALKAVGEIIQDYDSDKLFPALGFGARLPPDGRVSHQFYLNGHPTNPYCQGIDGVLNAYHTTLNSVQLYGPTNFAPCINYVASIARDHITSNDYFILLILTDGVITDMEQTRYAIVQASLLPISIIIVGIGEADFEDMNILDGDEERLSSRGHFADRDIVQFVPFREFINKSQGQDLMYSQALLAKEVLAEIPEQFTSFMKKHNIKPRPALQRQPTIPSAPPT